MNLTDLKAKATAAELTLIEKVEELVRVEVSRDAEDAIIRRAENWLVQNRPSDWTNLREWCARLAKVIRGQ
jgi:hypothetical protein